jgi:hypothetical protein
MTEVVGEDGVTLLDRGRCDQQVIERQDVPFRRFLTFDLPDEPSCRSGYGMHGQQGE